jgi:hypothetical protein
MKTAIRTPRNGSAARAPKQAAKPSATERALLARCAATFGELIPEQLRSGARDLEEQAEEMLAAARWVERNGVPVEFQTCSAEQAPNNPGGVTLTHPAKPEQAVASLTLVDRRDPAGKWLALTEFTLPELEGLKTCAARDGETLPQFLESAIQQKLAASAARAAFSDLQLLILGCDECEDGLWASPSGQLYFWDGTLSVKPRAIDLATAREWWTKFHARNPGFAAPYFQEGTDAAQFVLMVCQAENQKREQEIPDLETAIMKSVALTTLLADRLIHCCWQLDGDVKQTFDAGMSFLTSETNAYLSGALYDKNKMARVVPAAA